MKLCSLNRSPYGPTAETEGVWSVRSETKIGAGRTELSTLTTPP